MSSMLQLHHKVVDNARDKVLLNFWSKNAYQIALCIWKRGAAGFRIPKDLYA